MNTLPKADAKKTPADKSRKRTGSPKTGGAKKVAKRIGQVRGNEWMKDQSGMVYRRVPANHNLIAKKTQEGKEQKKVQKRKRANNVVVIPKRPESGKDARLRKRIYKAGVGIETMVLTVSGIS